MKISHPALRALLAPAGLATLASQVVHAEIISNGNLNTLVDQFANTVGTIVYSLDTATGNVLRSNSPSPTDTGFDANQWLWTAITRGFDYNANGGSGDAGDGAFVPNTAGLDTQNHRAVLQFANDGKTTTGSQTIKMDVFLDDNTIDNALTFRVELYAWDGTSSPGLSVGGPTTGYNTTDLNGATTLLDTTIPATSVADAAWQSVTLGTVDLGSGYNYYVWRIGVFGQTDGDVFKFDNVTVIAAAPVEFRITSFTPIDMTLGIWEAALVGASNTPYVFRSSANLDFSTGNLVENLSPGVPAVGAIGGTNDREVTTDGNGDATVRMTLTGNPSDFVRAESVP